MGENLWKLPIGYPHEYYGMPAGEKILQLAFVFRNSDGTRTGRDVGGADIFYDLFEPGLSLVINEPVVDFSYGDPLRFPVFVSLTDTIHISAKAATVDTEADSIKLFIGDEFFWGVNDSVLTYDFIASNFGYGPQEITLVGSDTAGITDSMSFFIVVNRPIKNAELPEGVIDGINYLDDNSVVLSLFAPFKDFIYVIGDFNDWKVDTSFYMNRHYINYNNIHYWLMIDSLDLNEEYAFQYLVDGEIRIADPYTEKVLDPWNDHYISYSTYPDLKPYPSGKTGEIVSTFQINRPEHDWQVHDFEKPSQHELIIYELLIRDFINAHDYTTLIDTLDYLENLGINVIELMPINEFEGNSSWGYNPSFYFAPDKYYGPANDLKQFIDKCHSRGIAVIMDIVLNHSYGQSPLVRLYDHGDHTTSPENPWYNEEHSFINPDAHWGYDFDHESPATQYVVDRVNRYWITEYKIDGFRFDFTKGFTNNIKGMDDPWGSKYDADRVRLLERMADQIWAVDSSIYVILEHLADNYEEKVLADYGMMLWGNINYNYSEATMGWHKDSGSYGKSDFSWGYYGSRGWDEANLVTYMESHDEERLMYKNLQWGNRSGDYDIRNLATALNRIKLTAGFFFTYPGPKMIWQFGELGYDVSIDDPCRICEKPIRWNYFEDWRRKSVYKTFQALIKLRKENDVFKSPETIVDLSVSREWKRIRLSHPLMKAVIIGNFDVMNRSVNPIFYNTGKWYEYFTGDSVEVINVNDQFVLKPGELRIYTTSKLETPEQGILSDIEPYFENIPERFYLCNNYPNPFNSSTAFEYELDIASIIEVQIFDLLGREIYSKRIGNQNPGLYKFTWNGKDNNRLDVQSGIYFALLKRKGDIKIQKVTLLK